MKQMERIKHLLLSGLFLVCSISMSGAIVNGTVKDTSGIPIANAGVSDGRNIVTTDADGHFTIETDKANGYLFAITPSGYEPATSNVNRPKFWQLLTAPADTDEEVNFKLRKIDDKRFAFITLADIQIGNHRNDVHVFSTKSVPDINRTIAGLRQKGLEPIALTLGDQSWDLYWHKNNYALPEALADLEKIECQVYNVIGNHDHNPRVAGDRHSSDTWRKLVGPNYYSFNKGDIHFVILDNVNYINDGATLEKTGKRNYTDSVSSEQMDWLKQDLALVSHDTPIVIAMHVPLYRVNGGYHLENGADLAAMLEQFDDVRVLTGHAHRNSNHNSESGRIKENNYGAVCGTWWWTELPDYGNNGVCRDGTPAGYAVWEVDGRNLAGQYKGTGLPIDYQFRAYDMNTLPDPEKNGILINIWGWAPGWKVEVKENGNPLKVEQVTFRDPLYIISGEEPQTGQMGKKPLEALDSSHFFKTKAKKANSKIDIKVTDAEGRTYTQHLERPKQLAFDMK